MKLVEEIFGLAGRVVVVVGASSGLGSESARILAGAGANVAVVARRKDRLESLARELEDHGVQARAIAADATDDEALQRAFDEVESELGPIWSLVNSAGISRLGRATKHSRKKWDEVIAVNLTAGFVMSQQVAQKMIERGDAGRIIHISSIMGQGASSIHPQIGYIATKAGLNGLVRQLAVEWADYGITVNGMAPGYFPTELTIDPGTGEMDSEFNAAVERLTPLGRTGKASEIGSALLYLTAPGSTYVTGSIVAVDGGWTAW